MRAVELLSLEPAAEPPAPAPPPAPAAAAPPTQPTRGNGPPVPSMPPGLPPGLGHRVPPLGATAVTDGEVLMGVRVQDANGAMLNLGLMGITIHPPLQVTWLPCDAIASRRSNRRSIK